MDRTGRRVAGGLTIPLSTIQLAATGTAVAVVALLGRLLWIRLLTARVPAWHDHVTRLVPLAVILSTLTEETSRAAAAAASSSASTTAATSTPTPTTTASSATARAAAIGGIGEIKLRRLDEWRRLHQ